MKNQDHFWRKYYLYSIKKNIATQGFTLIELIVVFVILGVLAAAAIPIF